MENHAWISRIFALKQTKLYFIREWLTNTDKNKYRKKVPSCLFILRYLQCPGLGYARLKGQECNPILPLGKAGTRVLESSGVSSQELNLDTPTWEAGVLIVRLNSCSFSLSSNFIFSWTVWSPLTTGSHSYDSFLFNSHAQMHYTYWY